MEVNRQFSDKALEDFQLIDEATIKGDESAFAKLMERYKKPVYHMILKMVRNVDDAEDLTIEAFAKAFKSLKRFKKDYTFSTWLFRIATNNAIDFIRKKKLGKACFIIFSSCCYDDENKMTFFCLLVLNYFIADKQL